ncbi:MAG: DUF2452 domain-containing protein [Microscillaceae bacterium]|jgi:hypothetical protein|nr:DUF2452 domain-containing protein [Microscillaceae bacterium]
MIENQENEEFINPIDESKVAENPATLPYAHTVGGVVIKPTEQGAIKAKALTAMQQQTDKQMQQLYEQMQTLAEQAKSIQSRVEVSRYVYEAEIPFEPVIGHTYYLYLRENGRYFLSMIAAYEWGKSMKFTYIAKVSLLADHTWEVLEENVQSF